ncbi:MAG: ketoacyl-ACP synthase III [Spirochaetales bacterium]|nr:ketoacyl-ACP synthase III [Spirochaetales bacterium]
MKIIGTGSYLPQKIMTNHDLEAIVDTSDEWIVKRTGIRERHIASKNESTSDLAYAAAKNALAMAGIPPTDIDMLIVATSTPDYPIPAVAPIVASKLGCGQIAAFDINSVCSGFSVAILNAYGMLRTGLYRTVLVIGADTYSRILNWTDRTSCCIFGDGAGAAILQFDGRNNIISHKFGTDGARSNLICIPAGGAKNPIHSLDPNGPNNDLFFQMDGRSVYEFSIDVVPKTIVQLIEEAKIQPTDISAVLLHQANIRIIDAIAKYLDIPRERYLSNVDRVGNTSSASLPILLDEAVRGDKIHKGDKVMVIGFGGGLSWCGYVMEW